MELLFGSVILKEMFHYNFYNRLLDFVNRKKYNSKDFNYNWYENYMLNELSVDELKISIRNIFSYNKPSENMYYVPIEIEDIPRGKMFKWVAYNLYFKSMWQLSHEQQNHASEVLIKLEEKLNIQFKDVNDPSIYFLKFGNNKIECSYRPSIICSYLDLMKDACYMALYLMNFDKYKVKGTNITYFHYYNKENTKTVMFIHGLGFGIEPYLYYILRLRRKYNLIVPILPNISNMEYMRSTTKITYEKLFPEYDTWRNIMKHILIKHNIEKINFIGHSFGTIILSSLLQNDMIKNRTDKTVYMEPVCFIDKAYKIYRYINDPQEGNYGMISKIFNKFIYDDIYLRYVTQRFLLGPEFWVHDYNDMSNNSFVIVSEKDQVVPSEDIYEKMKKYNIKCMYLKESYHADMFMSNKYCDVFDQIDGFIS